MGIYLWYHERRFGSETESLAVSSIVGPDNSIRTAPHNASVSVEGEEANVDIPLDLTHFQPGEKVLISGPALTEKRRLLFGLLHQMSDWKAIVISTKRNAEQFRCEFQDQVPNGPEWELRIVDCVSKSRGIRALQPTDDVAYVSTPSDLTGIGIATSGFMREFYHTAGDAFVGLNSLSTLLMYANLQRVFRFNHVLTGRIEASNFRGVFTLDTTHHTEAITTLQGLFDALIQVRSGDTGLKLRVRGSAFGPRQWTSF